MKRFILSALLAIPLVSHAGPIAPSLGDILDDFATPPVGAYGIFDTGHQFFTPIDSDGVDDDSDFLMLFELAGWKDTNTFGFYMMDTNNIVQRTLQIFEGPDSGLDGGGFPSTNTLSWNFAGGTVTEQEDGGTMDVSEVINNMGWQLGAYIDTRAGRWHSHDFLNSDGQRHVGVFDISAFPGVGGDRVLAWEDVSSPNWDEDYNDMVLSITDIRSGVSVPEPASVALFGLGALLLGLRKKLTL